MLINYFAPALLLKNVHFPLSNPDLLTLSINPLTPTPHICVVFIINSPLQNFVWNSCHVRDEATLEELWNVFNAEPQSTKDSTNPENIVNGCHNSETTPMVEAEGKTVEDSVDIQVEEKSLEPQKTTEKKRKRDKVGDQALDVDVEAKKMKRKKKKEKQPLLGDRSEVGLERCEQNDDSVTAMAREKSKKRKKVVPLEELQEDSAQQVRKKDGVEEQGLVGKKLKLTENDDSQEAKPKKKHKQKAAS